MERSYKRHHSMHLASVLVICSLLLLGKTIEIEIFLT